MPIDKGFKREIGVWGLSSNIINIIIGAGIFVLPAIIAEGLGAASITAFLFCGLLISLIMLCFAEIGSKITQTGGTYTFIEVAFGKYFGFLAAILHACSCITADAAVANALADIIGFVIPLFKENFARLTFFLALFSGLAYINVIGVKQGIGLVKINTIAKLAPLLLLILIGWTKVSISNLTWEYTPSLSKIGEMSIILFFAFQGAESGLTMGGEVRNPSKTIPKAILISTLGILTFYILIQTISQGVLGSALPSFKESPLGEVARQIFGPIGFTIITIGAAFSMFGNLSGEVLSIPRLIYGAARDRVIPPKALSNIHKKYSTPYISIITYTAFGFLFTVLGGFKQLAILSGISVLLIYLGIACAVIKLRKTKDTATGVFKIPGGYTIPIASILVILWFLSNLTKYEHLGILVFIAILTCIYILMNYLRNRIR